MAGPVGANRKQQGEQQDLPESVLAGSLRMDVGQSDKAHKVSALQLSDLMGSSWVTQGLKGAEEHQLEQDVIGAVGVVVADSTSCTG